MNKILIADEEHSILNIVRYIYINVSEENSKRK